ncbi:hypothetical protein SAY87_019659 [Trapa incisa]|uniref:Wall-associated receptor kinase galacturonan-binding domain-containing protein n=1 Tax=Trapa incisa TaxID=236973 RepID=A0AAN7Q2Z0_9MYRT|nr:hypothetical protein SAY87_019659 [Trapa incisa]
MAQSPLETVIGRDGGEATTAPRWTPVAGAHRGPVKSRGSFSCGSITGVSFPFWGGNRPDGCGYPPLKLNCEGNSTFISIAGLKYSVLGVDSQTQVLRIARQDFLLNGICLKKYIITTLHPQLFDFVVPRYMNFRYQHDINLASMAVNRIQNSAIHEHVDPELGFGADYTVRKTMTLVAELAFRCMQEDRDMRPTIA